MPIGWNYRRGKGKIMGVGIDVNDISVWVEVWRDGRNGRAIYADIDTAQGRRLLQRGRKLQDMIMNREVS